MCIQLEHDCMHIFICSGCRLQRPSRAQINQMLSKLNAKLNAIDQIIQFYGQPAQSHVQTLQGYLQNLKTEFTQKQTAVNSKMSTYLTAQLECMYDRMTTSDWRTVCNHYENVSTELLQSLEDEAIAMANRDDFLLNTRNAEDYIKYLNNQKDELNRQHQQLYALLGEMDPVTGGILDADQLAIANLSDAYKDNNWLEFSFDQASSYERTQASSYHESISASGGTHFLFFHIGASYTHTKDTSHFEQHLANSNMKAKGKLLRVNVKRPWFKPEIFEDPTLYFVSCTLY